MATQIKLRRDTYQNWFDNNPVLGLAEPGYDTTNKKLKIGDGTTTWRLLPYFDDQESILSAVNQDILPSVDSNGTTGYTLGSPDFKWKELFVSNGSIYIGDVKLSNVAGKLIAVKVINPGEVNEANDPTDSDAATGIRGTAYTLPTATTSVLGGVKVDGTTVTITDGVISSVGGGGGDANIWVQTFESQDGAPTDVVGIAISVEYDSAGNVISLFTHSNAVGNNYYSVGKYTTTGTKIWTARFADGFDTDGWGLAVDNNSNSIYVAGQTTPETGYSVSTLTKLDSSDGTIEWSKTYDFGFASQSAVVDVDSDGNPIMVGYASNGNDNYITTTKVAAADGRWWFLYN